MFEQVLLLTAVMLGVTFVRLGRRFEAGRRAYVAVVGGVLGLAVFGLVRESRSSGVAAIALAGLVVVIPWLLERVARLAFARGRLALAARCAAARSVLMPGAGLSRQQAVLEGLALLEREGAERALDHFRGLLADADDGEELAVINEQILSMLFYGHRWDESIAHYEARFHPRYAAFRPALALGLMRAYGEVGQLDRAAGLLRALEEGPVGADPRTLGLVCQARLTFLAYAGAARPVWAALTDEHRRRLGLSAASGALFRGIASARGGDTVAARGQLERVQRLATGREHRVVDASARVIAGLGPDAPAAAMDAELSGYADAVAGRLEAFLRAAPKLRRSGALLAMPGLLVAMLVGYLAVLACGRGGYGLIDTGALTPVLWRMGHWDRLLPSIFLHAEPLGALLDIYSLWLAVPLVERIYGSARVIATGVLGAVLGLAVSAHFHGDGGAVLGGGHLLAMTITAGALTSLLPFRVPGMNRRSRRVLAMPLGLVVLALGAGVIPGVLGVDVSVPGLVVAAAVGVFGLGLLPPALPGARVVAIALGVGLVASTGRLALRDADQTLAAMPRTPIALGGVLAPVPDHFEWVERQDRLGLTLPIEPGLVDTLALRRGDLVEFVVTSDPSSSDHPLILALDPALDHELTLVPTEVANFAAAYRDAGGDAGRLQAFELRRDGAVVGVCIERESESEIRMGLLASSHEALGVAPRLYATILADSAPLPDPAPSP